MKTFLKWLLSMLMPYFRAAHEGALERVGEQVANSISPEQAWDVAVKDGTDVARSLMDLAAQGLQGQESARDQGWKLLRERLRNKGITLSENLLRVAVGFGLEAAKKEARERGWSVSPPREPVLPGAA